MTPKVRICRLAAVNPQNLFTELLQARLNIQDRVEYLEQMLQIVLMQQDRLNSTIHTFTNPFINPRIINRAPLATCKRTKQATGTLTLPPPTNNTNHLLHTMLLQVALNLSKTVNNALPSSAIKKEKLIPAAGEKLQAACRWRAK